VIECSCNNLTTEELSKVTPEEYEEIVQCGTCRETWEGLRHELKRHREEGLG
jgi:hypothetical protein